MPRSKIRSSKDKAKIFEGKSIDIVVGRDRKVYSVHERLLRKSSSFFKAAMSGRWKESSERVIAMPDDEPKVFGIYVHWLYSGTLPVHCGDYKFYGSDNEDEDSEEGSDNNMESDTADDEDDLPSDDLGDDLQDRLADYLRERASEDPGKGTGVEEGAAGHHSGNSTGALLDSLDRFLDDEYLTLVKAYVLGDKIIDPTFQNAAVDAIIEKSSSEDQDIQDEYPRWDAIDYAYKNTQSSAHIRRLLVDLYVRHGDQTWIGNSPWESSDSDMIPQAFLRELAWKLYANRDEDLQLDEIKPSDYHIFS